MFSRKEGNTKPDVNSDASSSRRNTTKSSRSLFSLSKTLSRTSTTSNNQGENVNTPLGLNLLHSPESPNVDLIFVHGLGGGSRKTWSKSSLQSHFWPQEWLPKDPVFQRVRIHSYGYDSNYLKGKEDCLNIHHIGKSFLAAISTSPNIVDSGTNIVTVGHSMGGLVIKKAHILAKQDSEYKALTRRFTAIYFLATPHRGSNLAKMLKNLLKLAYDRGYVRDLEPNSEAVQVINDEFRHFSDGLELWSFYETQKMKLFSSLIVDPESAVLGYREEKQIPMTADHRSICKFDTPTDPNYALLRNALASTVNRISTESAEPKPKKQRRDYRRNLKKYLAVTDMVDDDLANIRETRMRGSCVWVSNRTKYLKWRDGNFSTDMTLWIKGKPATGKSVLAGYIIDQLRESGQECSYFFFKHGDKSKSTLGQCLRSLAFQMASSNVEVFDVILEMQEDGVCFDRVDERTLWRILFCSAIFPATKSRHYWVIDALDECSNASAFLHSALCKMDESTPLRILITSRNTVDLDRGFLSVSPNLIQCLSISMDDTKSDLNILIESKIQRLAVVEPDYRVELAERILHKSGGSFLWTILVLDEIIRCHSRGEVQRTLEDVPKGMESLYSRILEYMSQAGRGKELAKSILMWAVCAVRPMTVGELNGALTMGTEDSFPRLEESISALCGQLVVVDRSGRVKMVHETAREFLLAGAIESEFFVEKTNAHTRMAQVCLSYLVGQEMKPRRNNRRRSAANLPAQRLDFASYAYTGYSHHLSRADPLKTETFQLALQFLRSNVLTWIETIAESQKLNHLIRASKHIRSYTNACAAERSPLDPQIQFLRQWATDLTRIVAMFAPTLALSPSAIYSTIPPFCPTESMVHHTGTSGQSLTVLGGPSKQWDDRLLCIEFSQGQPRVLSYGDEFVAIGLSSGICLLYHTMSYQEYKSLKHGEAVKFIAFKAKTDLVATYGMKMVRLWNLRTGKIVHSIEGPPGPLGMEFDGDTLSIASQSNFLANWDLTHGTWSESGRRTWSDEDTLQVDHKPQLGTPCALTISTSHRLLAVAYSNKPITIWDLESSAYVSRCGKKLSNGDTSTHIVVALAFNPNPDLELLVVAYLDGDLALLDPFANREIACIRANCQTLAPSPDGRLLAVGGTNGIIQIYEFDTFKLLYQVKSSNSFIKQLAFSRDSLHLADIRGSQWTVWEPESLLRESLSDVSTGSSSTKIVEMIFMEAKVKVTAMAVHHTADVIFYGKDDGSVALYERKTATSLGVLYSHKASVRLLAWIESRDAILSIDASNKIFLHKVQKSTSQGWLGNHDVLFRTQLDSGNSIMNALVGEKPGKFLVSTRESDHIFSLDSGKCEAERQFAQTTANHRWLPHPESPFHLLRIDNLNVCVCCWNNLSGVLSFPFLLNNSNLEIKSATLCSLDDNRQIIVELSCPNHHLDFNKIWMINAHYLDVSASESESSADAPLNATMASLDSPLSDQEQESRIKSSSSTPAAQFGYTSIFKFELKVSHVLGIHQSRFVYLNWSSWVCSVDLHQSTQTGDVSTIEIHEHFFIPYNWFAGKRDIVCALAKGDIIVTRAGDLAVIRGGLKHAESVVHYTRPE